MIEHSDKLCPRCGSRILKTWGELTEAQQMLVRALPASAEFELAKRKKHRFCTQCWFEETEPRDTRA